MSYPLTVEHGTGVRLFRFNHRIVGGDLASYKFDVALEQAPTGCVVDNVLPWSEEQQDLKLGSWPGVVINLKSDADDDGGEVRRRASEVDTRPGSARDISLAANCRGVLGFAVVAVPEGGPPIVKHISLTVT